MNCCTEHVGRAISSRLARSDAFMLSFREVHPTILKMPFELRSRIWLSFIKKVDPIQATYEKDVERYFKKQFKWVVAKLPSIPTKPELEKWVKELEAINKKHITLGADSGGTAGINRENMKAPAEEFFDIYSD